jgi:uncharacterized repeat protein (TIGR04138 family)
MQKMGFHEAVERIVAQDPRYDSEVYLFMRDALDFTMKKLQRATATGAHRHVSGQELLEGVRDFALQEYGPMVRTVLNYWGVQRCDDFGNIVFNLIRAGIFGKSEQDRPEDFGQGYDFDEAFGAPFRPARPRKRIGQRQRSRS